MAAAAQVQAIDEAKAVAEPEVVAFGSGEELLKWVQAESEEAKRLHEEDKLYQAGDRLAAIRASIAAHGDEEGRGKASEWFEAQPYVEEVKERRETSDHLLDKFLNDDGWDVLKDSGGRQTLYRCEEDLGTHSFKVRGTIDAPLVHVAAALLEVQLFKLWFPMCKDSETLAHPSRYRKLARVVVSCPWPVANRETLVEGFGVEALERGMVIVNIKSVDEYPGLGEVEVKSGCVRAVIHHGGFLIEPTSRSRCRFSMMINVDPKLPVIPFSVLNWFSGKLISYILTSIEHAATSFDPNASALSPEELAAKKKKNKKFAGEDSPFVEAIRANEAIYDYMNETFESFFQELERKEREADAAAQ